MSSRAKEAAEPELPYPVLEERLLASVPRRFLRVRRDLTDLPDAGPGAVLVFRHGSRYVAFNETRRLTGAEEPVVEASAVCLVDMRTRYFTVHCTLPSASAADDFTARATFRARVTSPERAAEEGPVRMTRFLITHLGKDPRLPKVGSEYYVDDIATVRDLVASRIEAHCQYHPIHLPGIAVELESAGVLTPRELRRHEQDLRDERRRQQIAQLRNRGEDVDIQRYQNLVDGGVPALTAAGLATGQTSVREAIDNAREDDQRQEAALAEAMRILQQNGGMDYLDIDPTDLAQAYVEKLTGHPIARSQGTGLRHGDSEKREALGSGGDDEDDAPPDEAGLDE